MKIYPLNIINYDNPSFEGRGKPISLKYIVDKHSDVIPSRVLEQAKAILKKEPESSISLKDLHISIYSKLLEYSSLNEAKNFFKEFEAISESVTFEKNTANRKNFEEKTKGMDFPLKILQELWAKLKNKEDIANELGVTNRSWLNWVLSQINFVSYSSKYKTLLKASDIEGNKEISRKTREYNEAHPDLMYERNKHAAQGCKTEGYRIAQRQRMLEYDKKTDERRSKISEFGKRAWALCPDVKILMKQFAMQESSYTRSIIKKEICGENLSDKEKRVHKGFYKRFFTQYPQCKESLSRAKAQVREEMKKDK